MENSTEPLGKDRSKSKGELNDRRPAGEMLYEFLQKNQVEILEMTEAKSLELAGIRPSSDQLKKGLPIFFDQLLTVLRVEASSPRGDSVPDEAGKVNAAIRNDEEAMANADGRPDEAEVAKAAGRHGRELLRLGYTLSHVIHAYGSMCQSITELATTKNMHISASEFHDLNRCLDTAIAGAVTEYQAQTNSETSSREVEHLGFLAHELRNALGTVKLSLELIKEGTVGFGGSVGLVLNRGIERIENLIDHSLTEVRLRVDPTVRIQNINVLQLVNQIVVTAGIEAGARKQIIEIAIATDLNIDADQQLIYSALSNLVQNAIKYTHRGGKIHIRASTLGDKIFIEVEDECGGLADAKVNLFKPFEQQNTDQTGLGLGLTIAKRAIELNGGAIEVRNLVGKGCIFKITFNKMPDRTAKALH